ncbi:MAG: phospholipase [Hyphomicrobiales bacterium]|nr:MAG: phospholipase [Hyphomicrobiales bacterium]
MARLPAILALVALVFGVAAPANAAGPLGSYKDELFRYPSVLHSEYDGDFQIVEYNEDRDLKDRDEVDERRVFRHYVSLFPKRMERDLKLQLGKTSIGYIVVGEPGPSSKMIVIYLHGRNGNRHQGANDWMFGGNFNRIKNLMARNDGIYLSPDFTDFGKAGTEEIKALMKAFADIAPNAKMVLACGSMGGLLCWNLAKDKDASKMIDGMLLLGSVSDDGFLKSAAVRSRANRFPIYLGHGSFDPYIPWKTQQQFFKRVRRASPGYPIKFVLFDSGTHGTPIRMTDWRLVLNWMLQAR